MLLLFAALLTACREEERQPLPLEEEQLVDVLADVHIAEAAGQQLRGATKDSVMQVYYAQICSIHRVDQEDFMRSMKQLRDEPKRLHQLYEKVTESIERTSAKAK